MKYFLLPALLLAGTAARAQAVSHRDRVYTADQISNTVSVIDPMDNKLLGQVILGKPQPDLTSALYRGQALVHGLGASPDHRLLAVVSVGSNNVTFIETATNALKGSVYVGRAPHEPTFRPDGKEVWVTVRGEDYLSVIDAATLRETRRIQVPNGPGQIAFSPDGKRAFVCSSFSPELAVIDVATYRVIKKIPVVSPFSPNIFPTKDGQQIWFTHKDVGKVSVLDTKTLTINGVLTTGPITNHVATVDLPTGKLAYVTVGGEDVVKVYSREAGFKQLATIAVGANPHGIWPAGDGSRVYVGLENGDSAVAVLYVPDAVPSGVASAANLGQQLIDQATVIRNLRPPTPGPAAGTMNLRSEGLVDLATFNLRALAPNTDYDIYLTNSTQAPYARAYPLTTVHTDAKGGAMGQALGPVQRIASGDLHPAGKAFTRVVVAPKAADGPAALVSE